MKFGKTSAPRMTELIKESVGIINDLIELMNELTQIVRTYPICCVWVGFWWLMGQCSAPV